jgi:predicted kinase
MESNCATLIVVCGLPGAGKTTHARKLEAERGAVRFCADEWMAALDIDLYNEAARARIEGLQWRLAQQLLARGASVIIEWGTWARSQRDGLREGARALGARVELHYLSATVDVLWERIQKRGMEQPAIKRGELERWAGLFQIPDDDEAALFDDLLVLTC